MWLTPPEDRTLGEAVEQACRLLATVLDQDLGTTGQDRAVQVPADRRGVPSGTASPPCSRKRELADAVLGCGEGWIAELSNKELVELVALRAAV